MYAVSDFADFICELDQLKAVKRQITLPCDNYRQENSAEHSWHVALMANMLSEYFASDPTFAFHSVVMPGMRTTFSRCKAEIKNCQCHCTLLYDIVA